jgi:hypothetical protein
MELLLLFPRFEQKKKYFSFHRAMHSLPSIALLSSRSPLESHRMRLRSAVIMYLITTITFSESPEGSYLKRVYVPIRA